MQFRVRTDDALLEAAFDQYRTALEERNNRKYTQNQAALEMIREFLLNGTTSQMRRLNDRLSDLTNVLQEHTSAENILIFTLINGMPPDDGGKPDEKTVG